MTVTGPPSAICSAKSGTTDPLLPSTFPKRTATKCVRRRSFTQSTSFSARRLVAPITLLGETALSLEMSTNFAWCAAAASATFSVPNTLFSTACARWLSIIGTCLNAAA